jgi:hypothetical protein
VQSRVGSNLWQVDPSFKARVFTFCQKSFCMFHRGRLSLNLVQNFLRKYSKENDSLMNWNEIKDFVMPHLF